MKVGQKVVCINNKPICRNPFNDSLQKLIEQKDYTIEGFTSSGIILKEVKSSHPNGGYNANRFRLIDDTWVDEVLCNIIEEVEVEYVIIN